MADPNEIVNMWEAVGGHTHAGDSPRGSLGPVLETKSQNPTSLSSSSIPKYLVSALKHNAAQNEQRTV